MHRQKKVTPPFILFLQIMSISIIWLLFIGVNIWIINLIRLSRYLQDAQNATVVISIIILPLFGLLASVLTYVFVGLRKARFED
ncbi:MAG: hypothetical protein V3S48_07515 [Candidatus Neomarinimicrobiota bacterium]